LLVDPSFRGSRSHTSQRALAGPEGPAYKKIAGLDELKKPDGDGSPPGENGRDGRYRDDC